jgi:hypothetical protein
METLDSKAIEGTRECSSDFGELAAECHSGAPRQRTEDHTRADCLPSAMDELGYHVIRETTTNRNGMKNAYNSQKNKRERKDEDVERCGAILANTIPETTTRNADFGL